MKHSIPVLLSLFSVMVSVGLMTSCKGDEMSQDLEIFIPVNAKVENQFPSETEKPAEETDPSAVVFNEDYIKGNYIVGVRGKCQRPGGEEQSYMFSKKGQVAYTQVALEKKGEKTYKVKLTGFQSAAWDYPFDIEADCRVVNAMYDDEYFYVLESTDFEIDLNAVCAYKQIGNKVAAVLEGKVYKNKLNIRLYTDLSWSPKKDPSVSYDGYADMQLSCEFDEKTMETVGNAVFGEVGDEFPDGEFDDEIMPLDYVVGKYRDPGMLVDVDGVMLDPLETTISTEKVGNNKVKVLLKDFKITSEDGTEMEIGDIEAECKTAYSETLGGYALDGETDLLVQGALAVHPVLKGTITNKELKLTINIDDVNVVVNFNGVNLDPKEFVRVTPLSDMAGTYRDEGMNVSVDGTELDPIATDIETTVEGKNVLKVALYDFKIETEDGTELSIGDIKAECKTKYNAETDGYNLEGETDLDVQGLPVHPVLKGTVTKEKLKLTILIEDVMVTVEFEGARK